MTVVSVGDDLASLERQIRQRLVGVHGVRIARTGTLAEDQFDHRAGTPYVLIAAHSVQAADFAEAKLAEIARLPAVAWARGWEKRDNELVLRIFPEIT